MAREAAASSLPTRAFARVLRRCALLLGLMLAVPIAARADPVKGTASWSVSGGFARLIVKLDEDVETDVSVAGTILVVRFKRPVDVAIDKMDAAPDYVGSARRDPDGSAIRFALARKVSVNTMMAGERTFIDLLPDSWTGLPPGLPQQVVRELAERARVAERALKAQRAANETRKRPPIRLRASVQPTFVRFVVEIPEGVGVSSSLNDQTLSLSFNAALTFDLADAKLAAPPNVGAITQKSQGDKATIDIGLIGDVDVRSFREDKNYIVDVMAQQAEKPPQLNQSTAAPTAPAASAAPAPKPVANEPAANQPATRPGNADISQPTSESIAQLVSRDALTESAKPQPSKSVARPDTKAEAKQEPAAQRVAAGVASVVPVSTPPLTAAATPTPPRDVPAAQHVGSVEARRSSDALRLNFTFAQPMPVALFRRADVMWLVLDSDGGIDLAPIRREGGALIGDVNALRLDQGQAIRIRLNRPQLASLTPGEGAAGRNWTLTFADAAQTASLPLTLVRNVTDPDHARATVPLAGFGRLHRMSDPEAGDALSIVTALTPPRGFIRRQDFVEFSVLESVHGVVVQRNADDIAIEVGGDGVALSRPGGLTLSRSIGGRERAAPAVRPLFDLDEWQHNVEAPFRERRDALVTALAQASPDGRLIARGDLARFYFAHAMYPEARAIVDLMLADMNAGQEDPAVLTMHAIASALMDRPVQTLKDVAHPALAGSSDSQLWMALALAQQGKWAQAREKFKNAGFAIASLPPGLQRVALAQAMRASLEVKDYAGAAARHSELDIVGIPEAMKPVVSVMRGRLAEALGRERDALSEYGSAAGSANAPAAAEGKLHEIALRQKRKEITPADALRDLETLSAIWRGDDVEVRTLHVLSLIYADTSRYTDALAAARSATLLSPNSEVSRQVQDDAAALFSQLFLTPKGDGMSPIEALSVFYENRELTPIGRRGDEMIRRLAERLVAVDLLDQAAELLQYQVDYRIEGAARAQVAARLAMIYLMNRKPDRAIGALNATRITDLAGELRQQRLLLEARAQSDIGRRDLALDIISNLAGREAIRLRSDIHWASRRWREASEQIELYYGDRWRDFKPLDAIEKGDVIRAVIGYALAEDALGLARFREKYAPLMNGESDRTAFETASRPASTNSAEFGAIAKMAAGVDTLDGFLREMKSRFPDALATAPKPGPDITGALPEIVGRKLAEARR